MRGVGSIYQKAIAGGPDRRTRIHDRRGRRLSRTELMTVLPSVAQRLARKPADGPWFAGGAISFLSGLESDRLAVFEFGSGSSTSWFAERFSQVVSIEPDSRWALATAARTKDCVNVTVHHTSIADGLLRLEAQGGSDVVIVDHSEEGSLDRLCVLDQARRLANIVVLDDSDRHEYRHCDDLMEGFVRRRFVSYKSRPLAPAETTIYVRDSSV